MFDIFVETTINPFIPAKEEGFFPLSDVLKPVVVGRDKNNLRKRKSL